MKSLVIKLIIGNILITSAIIFFSYDNLQAIKKADEDAARQAVMNLSNSLGIEIGAEIRLIENALQTIIFGVNKSNEIVDFDSNIKQLISQQDSLLPQIASIRYADKNGKIKIGLQKGDKELSISNRDYFNKAKTSNDLIISNPLISQVTNEWCIIFSRRINGTNDEFLGVLYAVVSVDHLIDRFSKLDMGKSGVISLRNKDLRLIARYSPSNPKSYKGIGESLISEEALKHLSRGMKQGWYFNTAAHDGVERISAYSYIKEYPLIVFSGLATQEFLKPWYKEIYQQIFLISFIILINVSFSIYLFFRQKREHGLRVEAVKTAREQSLILENDLVGMLRIRDRIIVWENKAIQRIFGYESNELDNQSIRILYLGDEAFRRVGDIGYASLKQDGRFKCQLQMRKKDGSPIWIDLSGAKVSDEESLWMMVDIESIKRSENDARDLALTDPLTGLPNRRLFDTKLAAALENSSKNHYRISVCYLDLDGFKLVNDIHGHEAGDIVLQQVGKRIAETVRENDTVARLGGDEFAILLLDISSTNEAVDVMQRCLIKIQDSIVLKPGVEVSINASIGIVTSNGFIEKNTILNKADETMYSVKKNGKGNIKAIEIL